MPRVNGCLLLLHWPCNNVTSHKQITTWPDSYKVTLYHTIPQTTYFKILFTSTCRYEIKRENSVIIFKTLYTVSRNQNVVYPFFYKNINFWSRPLLKNRKWPKCSYHKYWKPLMFLILKTRKITTIPILFLKVKILQVYVNLKLDKYKNTTVFQESKRKNKNMYKSKPLVFLVHKTKPFKVLLYFVCSYFFKLQSRNVLILPCSCK